MCGQNVAMPLQSFFFKCFFQGGKMTDPDIIENNQFVWIVRFSRGREGEKIDR